ncbi:MAG: hypothetical protein ACE5IZ_05005 [Dehalococcoidia bacterium]
MAGNGCLTAQVGETFGLALRGEHIGLSWPPYLGMASWLREASKELPERVGSFWRDMRRRWEEAMTAGKESAREAEDELRRRHREAVARPRRRRR